MLPQEVSLEAGPPGGSGSTETKHGMWDIYFDVVGVCGCMAFLCGYIYGIFLGYSYPGGDVCIYRVLCVFFLTSGSDIYYVKTADQLLLGAIPIICSYIPFLTLLLYVHMCRADWYLNMPANK